jgi:hypothetical protein
MTEDDQESGLLRKCLVLWLSVVYASQASLFISLGLLGEKAYNQSPNTPILDG